ncbi:LPS export ABC transporter periplasmic protein LptC [Dethiosulfatarculus sandiegensis]|uniref:LPS export ABC transporter periplasmic protein LptC n=1 Tax=Dethiosulfatarculus sandiegensis TaxID=1429043 RepID=UPI0018D0F291|nr:LPS export ABC transporter periplasmic protein LptC [Dethiosulfatarculus sandiegensis]
MRRLRLIFLLALTAILVGTVAAYLLNPPVELPLVDTQNAPQMDADGKPRVQGLSYTQVTDGVRKWRLSADRAKMDRKTGVITLFNVNVTFFKEKGGWIKIKSDRADYDQKNQVVGLKGKVRGRTSDGLTLRTEAMTYFDKEKLVDTDYPVTVAGKRFKINSRGMKVFVPEERVVFKKEVDSTFIPVGSGPPRGATIENPN